MKAYIFDLDGHGILQILFGGLESVMLEIQSYVDQVGVLKISWVKMIFESALSYG